MNVASQRLSPNFGTFAWRKINLAFASRVINNLFDQVLKNFKINFKKKKLRGFKCLI